MRLRPVAEQLIHVCECPVVQNLFLIHGSQTWQPIAINEFERNQIADLRHEVDERCKDRSTNPRRHQ